MEPLSLALGSIGLGLQIFGGFGAAHNAKQASYYNKQIAAEEMKLNQVKQQKMELEGRRMQLESVRNNQKARALAEASAVNQGAQFGSGLQGGLGEIQGNTLTNMEGVNFGLQFGRQMAGINDTISGYKQQLADVQSEQAANQGLMSLGGSLMKAGPLVGPLGQGFGNLFGGGNYSGTPGAKNTGGLY